jgi:hypothetical protein
MDISLTESVFFLPGVIIGIIVLGIIAIILYQRRSKKRGSLEGRIDTPLHHIRHRLDYQPGTKPILGFIKPTAIATPQPVTPDIQKPKEIDLTSTCKNMTESLAALAEKYSLTSFTIATEDGLIVGSSGGDTTQSDAAIFSQNFKNDPLIETPGVIMFGLTWKGSELIGIIRTKISLPNETLQQIAADTKIILNLWV